ncbi:carbohydrate ABC transporter permease [Streptomyces sp. 4N509B]|uniref:carbohydrate ABC transporter permease n=1 Tax=Streptomyces sp. 4N509B TaxID=3457413 RepID=UPI003FCF80FB
MATTTSTRAGALPVTERSAGSPPPAPPRRGRARRAGSAGRQLHGGWLTYTVLAIFTLGSVAPLAWAFIASSHDNKRLAEATPPFWFGSHLGENWEMAWERGNVGHAMINTLFVASTITVATVLFCTLAGFAFAKLRFRARNLLMLLVIGTMMVPPQLTVVPLFMYISDLGWTDHLQAVILPMLVSAFGVFFMRQYLVAALPTELIEAARVDGAHSLRIVWHVVFPAARPAMAVLGMLTFVMAWNEFFWPLIVLSQNNPTVQVALTGIGQGYVPNQGAIMAGAVLATLPLLVALALFGRQIVGGIMHGAIKG